MEYDESCTTFEEIIESTLTKMRTKNVLYECVGENAWIRDVILKYNELGFYTWTSQPGRYNMRRDDNSRSRRQCAYVRGFMKPEMADYILTHLKVENIIVRVGINATSFDDPCKCGSVTFTGEVSDINSMDEDTNRKCMASFDLTAYLCRDHKWLQYFYPNLQSTNLIDVQIFDIRWNDNSSLWSSLLNVLALIDTN